MSSKLMALCPAQHQTDFAKATALVAPQHEGTAANLVKGMQLANWSWPAITAWFLTNWQTLAKVITPGDPTLEADIMALILSILSVPAPAPAPVVPPKP